MPQGIFIALRFCFRLLKTRSQPMIIEPHDSAARFYFCGRHAAQNNPWFASNLQDGLPFTHET
jgi:hypothetical protein